MDKPADYRKPSLLRKIKIMYYRRVSDRRRYLRKPLRIKVTEKVSGMFEHFTSTNISVGGMFLKSDRPFAVDAKLKIEFSLQVKDEDKVIIAEARVARTCPPGRPLGHCAGMGIEFTQIDPEDRKIIGEFVGVSGVY